ncbi:MAG TPA: flagellar hook-length control protein FliK, partial [Burkholderiaceae bacterium]|nr:flagellar hook-length control protein FliK [Burkholderiaceae bacterium]
EAHLAQWAHGERSTAAVRAEAQHVQRTFGGGEAATETRAAIALEVLQRQSIVLVGPAWAGQDVRLQVGREPDEAQAAAGAAPVFRAQLKFDLPRLGRVEVDLRLAGVAIAAAFAADANARAQLDAALPEIASALAAHGLQPVALSARSAQSPA